MLYSPLDELDRDMLELMSPRSPEVKELPVREGDSELGDNVSISWYVLTFTVTGSLVICQYEKN
jgi:hypothetical protein